MARAELIEAQRQALLLEMQHIRKDILQQEAWLRVRRPLSAFNPSPQYWALCKCAFAGVACADADVDVHHLVIL